MSRRIETINVDLVRCRRCPRLVSWREQVAIEKRASYRDEVYWGRPVPGFGEPDPRLLIVGLAPAAHGANRTGRLFTGDRSGQWLYRALHRAGFASRPTSTSADDGMRLQDAYITAIVRCAPPGNQPTAAERNECASWLLAELDIFEHIQVIVVLGGQAFAQVLRLLADSGASVPSPRPKFRHGQEIDLRPNRPLVLASYHPSQQNTFTGKLTEEMLDGVFRRARELLR